MLRVQWSVSGKYVAEKQSCMLLTHDPFAHDLSQYKQRGQRQGGTNGAITAGQHDYDGLQVSLGVNANEVM